MKTWCISAIYFLAMTVAAYGQTAQQSLDSLLLKEEYEAAFEILNTKTEDLITRNQIDSLSGYPYYIGKIYMQLFGTNEALRAVEDLISKIPPLQAGYRARYEAYISYMWFLDEIGDTKRSYEITQKALEEAKKMSRSTDEEIGFVYYNLGAGALNLGDYNLAEKHFREALGHYANLTPGKKLADAYNAMGAVMWLSTKLDSAQWYYQKSVDAMENSDADPLEKSFLAAITLANVALLQHGQGNTEGAIGTIHKTVANYQLVLRETTDENQRFRANRYLWYAMSNLAVFYNDIGDYTMANSILNYVYRNQKNSLHPNDPELIQTKAKIGQSLLSLKRSEEAQVLFEEALEAFDALDSEEDYWKAISLFGLAECAQAQNKKEIASIYFEQSQVHFERILHGNYDRQYLEFLRKKAFFHAEAGEHQEAVRLSQRGYEYTKNNIADDHLMQYKQLLNTAEVHFVLGDYGQTIERSNASLDILDRLQKQQRENPRDSVQFEFQKPKAILIQTRSEYELKENRDTVFLQVLLEKLNKAINILKLKKSIVRTEENIAALLEENRSIFEFAKQISLDLYLLTLDESYLESVILYHESALYNRIRTRLGKRKSMGFFNVPSEITAEEIRLKDRLAAAFTSENSEGESYFELLEEWNTFLENLRLTYPHYFEMRYQNFGPAKQLADFDYSGYGAVIRYLFIQDKLHAFLVGNTGITYFPLAFDRLAKHNKALLAEPSASIDYGHYHRLYLELWKPLESAVRSKKVMIIPDGELFNISFETLLLRPSDNPRAFSEQSLLSRHEISYHYSLLMLSQEDQTDYAKNYIAFAPGFFQDMKDDYRARIQDQLPDDAYLNLLSQPFTSNLIHKLILQFGGDSYLKQESTVWNFKNNAPKARILHIGTHAESDNVSPELSRLIFAKDLEAYSLPNANSLFAYEVYGLSLPAALTVLTACETGKPQYQPGEGMVSLAHAFHYAGSKSMLTGLWKIDEESSSIIVESFYRYLAKGLGKAEALRKAKLDYLQIAEGRTTDPAYWAGLVILGDPKAVVIHQQSEIVYWIVLPLILVFLIYVLMRRKSQMPPR